MHVVFLNPSVPAQSRCRPCGSPSPRRERGRGLRGVAMA
ncbi:hypothetical protein CSB95_1187 [Pseudomonas aeruginosa]|nr:hypothetical protein CSC29_4765 [Pseudomonas aeruginosa]PRW07117.1 hypothetical protein CSB95_1187 [Pseudomonas aeruginosa]